MLVYILWLLHATIFIVAANKSDNLSEIKTLTFYKDKWTTARRDNPRLQLKCVGGSAKCSFTPKLVQCDNKGSNGTDVLWQCKTNMITDYSFGQTTVLCEGFDYPEDPFILIGSCGLQYTLESKLESANLMKIITKDQSGNHKLDFNQKKTLILNFIFVTILSIFVVYPMYIIISHCWSDIRTRNFFKPRLFQKPSKPIQRRPTYHYDSSYQPTKVSTLMFNEMFSQFRDVPEIESIPSEDVSLRSRKNKQPPPYPLHQPGFEQYGPPCPIGFRPECYPDPPPGIGFRPEIFSDLNVRQDSFQQPLYYQCDAYSQNYSSVSFTYQQNTDAVKNSWGDDFPTDYRSRILKNTIAVTELKTTPSAPPLLNYEPKTS